MDLFATSTMLGLVDQTPSPTLFLRNRYFGNVKTFGTKTVDIDIVNGKQRVAPFVHPRIGGKMVNKDVYQTKTYEPPEVSPEMLTDAADIFNRLAGESPYSQLSPQQRAANQLAADLGVLDAMVDRREELMCAQAITQGKVIVKGDGYDEEVKYWTGTNDPYIALTSGALWSANTSDPLGDIEAAGRRTRKVGLNASDVLLGTDALDAFLKHEGVLKRLDNRRVDLGLIKPELLPDGVKYIGHIEGRDIFCYESEYYDEVAGADKPFIDPKLAIICSPRAATTMAYGAVAIVNRQKQMIDIVEGRRVPYSYFSDKNPQGQVAQIKAKPLPIVNQIQGFQVVKVLA